MNRQLRLVVFSESIISDIGNPTATTVRAMCQAFTDLGHDVTHLEQRGNAALSRMLQTRGYAPMRAFNERYPLIRYRQFDLPSGAERAVWFGREIATADAVVAFPGTPEEVVAELAARDNVQTVRFWPGADESITEFMPLWTDPAVLIRPNSTNRDRDLVVAYDNINPLIGLACETVTAGLADAAGWLYVPEVDLEAMYRESTTVAVDSTVELARALLPVANGAKVQLVDPAGQAVQTVDTVPENNNARLRAERLVEEITRLLTRNLRTGTSVA